MMVLCFESDWMHPPLYAAGVTAADRGCGAAIRQIQGGSVGPAAPAGRVETQNTRVQGMI